MDSRHKFGEKKWVGLPGQVFAFEILGLLNRPFEFVPRRSTRWQKYLHVGCGTVLLNDFLNLDYYSPKLLIKKLFKMVPSSKVFRGHDLRRPLPFGDNSFEGAFSEHTLEHIDPFNAANLLKEIHRVLKPDSYFRIVVPDLDRYLDFCNGKMPDKQFEKFAGGAESIWSLTQNWGHQSVWNSLTLGKYLEEAGFRDVKKVSFGKGSNPALIHDLKRRSWESLYMEARK